MKKYVSVLLALLLAFCFTSCDILTLPLNMTVEDTSYGETEPDTEDVADGQTEADTINSIHEVYYGYYDDLWLSAGVAGHPWLDPILDRTEIVGQEFDVFCTFMTEDGNYSAENYEFLFTVSDPTVAEITKKNVIPGGAVNKVWLKGLKPGKIRLEFKMIHKDTGGVYATYVDVTIIPAEEGT